MFLYGSLYCPLLQEILYLSNLLSRNAKYKGTLLYLDVRK
jgi:hypothetical protein